MRKAAETVDLNPARWLGVREEVPGKMVKYFRLSGQLKSAVQIGSGSAGAAGCCAAAEGRGGLPASPRIPPRRCVRSTADPGCSPPGDFGPRRGRRVWVLPRGVAAVGGRRCWVVTAVSKPPAGRGQQGCCVRSRPSVAPGVPPAAPAPTGSRPCPPAARAGQERAAKLDLCKVKLHFIAQFSPALPFLCFRVELPELCCLCHSPLC